MTGGSVLGLGSSNEHDSAQGTETLRWSIRPSAKDPSKRTAVLAVAATVGFIGTVLYGNLMLGLVGVAMILGATAEYWLGTEYRVDSEGAHTRCGWSVTSLAWVDVRRVVIDGNRILLSPLSKATRLDAFRGVRLVVPPEIWEEVRNRIDLHRSQI